MNVNTPPHPTPPHNINMVRKCINKKSKNRVQFSPRMVIGVIGTNHHA